MTGRLAQSIVGGALAVPALVAGLMVGLVGILVAGAASPAAAHDELVSVAPADGSTVEAAPASVDLVFAEPAIALGTEVQVLGPDGTNLSAGAPALLDATVSQPLAAVRPAGVYTVQWRVTSADGHPISGEFTFTTTAAAGAPAAPEPSPTEPAPTEPSVVAPTGAPSSAATAPAAPTSEPTIDALGEDSEAAEAAAAGSGALPWVVGGGLTAAALAGGAVWYVRRRA